MCERSNTVPVRTVKYCRHSRQRLKPGLPLVSLKLPFAPQHGHFTPRDQRNDSKCPRAAASSGNLFINLNALIVVVHRRPSVDFIDLTPFSSGWKFTLTRLLWKLKYIIPMSFLRWAMPLTASASWNGVVNYRLKSARATGMFTRPKTTCALPDWRAVRRRCRCGGFRR